MQNSVLASTPPVAGENTWGLAVTGFTSAGWITVPEEWKESVMELHADGEGFTFTFGGTSLTTVARTATSTVSGNAISAQGAVGYHLEAGAVTRVDMTRIGRNQKARLAVLAAGSTSGAVLRITRVSGYVR